MTTVRRLPQAEEDLLDLWCYIASDNPARADSYLDYLDEKLILLADAPGIGRLHNNLAPGLRVFPVDSYRIFYRQTDVGIQWKPRMGMPARPRFRTVVMTCELEQAEFGRDQIHAFGADWRMPRSKGSMSAIVEPAGA